jgi:hypothetical protein
MTIKDIKKEIELLSNEYDRNSKEIANNILAIEN